MIILILAYIMVFMWIGTISNDRHEINNALMEQSVPEITYDEFKSKHHSYCDTFNYEIIDIYEDGDTNILGPTYFYLDDEMKAQGFEAVFSGRGNWASGWSYVTLTLTKGDCTCEIMKKHWYADSTASGRNMITEQIMCNQNGPGNFYLGD